MGRIKVTTVTEGTINVLRELNRKIFPILTASQVSDNFYDDFLDVESGFALLAHYSDMLAGATCCLLEDDNTLYVRFIGVVSRHRRKGVGTELMKRVVKKGEELDVHRLVMYVRCDNKAAIRLGRKFGFMVTGENGPELVIMERLLHN